MTAATKKEAQDARDKARTRAQNAAVRLDAVNTAEMTAGRQVDYDAAMLHYQRCVGELEEAINDMSRFEFEAGED